MARATAYDDDYYTHDNNLETFALLWLDAAVSTSRENKEAQQQLRSTINYVTTFDNEILCEKYIRSVSPYDRLVLIVSGQLGETTVPHIHQLRQLSSIYVYCLDKRRNENWAKNFVKVKAVTDRLDVLISRIQADMTGRGKTEDSTLFNTFMVSDSSDKSTTELNGHFVHSLLLIDVLLRMKPLKTDKQELIELCKKHYEGNQTDLDILREFERDYSPEKALWWYTRNSFLYKMLNKALRGQNIDVLFLLRFFICDIHQELERNQCQLPIRVYRGQYLSNNELNNLQKSIGKFISTSSFFSTATSRQQALTFNNNFDISGDLHRVLFEIDADPRAVTTKPFADISSYSAYPNESEILFMTGLIFRVGNIRQNDDQVWLIQLTLCGDDEHDLKPLFEHMKKTYGGDNAVTLFTFGGMLHRMGKFDLAEKFYRRLLNELPVDDPSLSKLYYSLGLVLRDKKDLDSSLHCLNKSLKIRLQTFSHDYEYITDCYNAIGNIHRIKGDHNIALSWFNRGAERLVQENAADSLRMAHFYNNMALVYRMQENYTQALIFNEKALIIREQRLPSNHPDIGVSHNNIGNFHRFFGDYDLALTHFNQSLNIRLKSLPPDHPHVVQSYRNIGRVHEDMGELTQALEYFQKIETIYRQSPSFQHSDIARIEEDIGRVLSKLD